MERKTVDDRAIVAAQIGRSPRGAFAVSARCTYGFPQVIRVHPVVHGKPFPTLYWLTCPFLAKQIDHLEADGWVKRLELHLSEDPALGVALHDAHVRYCEARDRLLSNRERAALDDAGTLRGLTGRGIGGIADWTRVKCLHLHVAHSLADANPIGSRVLSMLPALECAPNKVICSAYE